MTRVGALATIPSSPMIAAVLAAPSCPQYFEEFSEAWRHQALLDNVHNKRLQSDGVTTSVYSHSRSWVCRLTVIC